MRIIPISQQATGAFNQGKIVENKPIGFPRDGGFVRPYSALFYWARAEGLADSTIEVHPHQGFEIMSFILEGRIRHFDTKLNDWKPLEAGDAQVIRAGNGISHAEHIERDGVIFQIWLDPDLSKTLQQEASYDDYRAADFHQSIEHGTIITHYAGQHGKMRLDTPGADIRKLTLTTDSFSWQGDKQVTRSLYIIKGSGTFNGKTVEQDDYIIIDDEADLQITPHDSGLIIFAISTPTVTDYPTYTQRLMSS